MSYGDLPRVLKRNVKRTVSLVEEEGSLRVVKRFHAPGRIDRLRDGHRARRESRALETLLERNLPAPRPIEVRRRGGFWELVLEHADGADLERCLAGDAPWPAPEGRVAVELGRLLGRLDRAGVSIDDMHAGNVLIGHGGRPLVLDGAGVGRGRSSDLERDLVHLAAGVRERASRRFRARFFLAVLDVRGRPDRETRNRIAERIERRARVERRRQVERRVRRWWRDSGATRPFAANGLEGFMVRDVDEAQIADLLEDPEGHLGPAFDVERVYGFAARHAWDRGALLTMHGIPCPAPLLVITTPGPRAMFARPAGTRPFPEAFAEAVGEARLELAQSAGAVCGAVDDRGLAPIAFRGLLATPEGEVLVAVEEERRRGRAPVDDPDPFDHHLERAAFDRAFVEARRGSAAERRTIARELGVD